jgi:hypothetical protein
MSALSARSGAAKLGAPVDRDADVDVDLEAVPRPWEYNPSCWAQRVRVALVALPALIGSIYLALFQWGLLESAWDPFFGKGTENVVLSDVSHQMTRFMRMPDAALGALAYLGDVLFALAGSTRRWQYRPWLVVAFGFDVIPLGIVSIVLVILQGTVIGSWCTICLMTAVVSLALIFLAYDEVWSSLLYLRAAWKRASGFREWWMLFWGGASEAGRLAARDVLASEFVQRRAERSRPQGFDRREVF